jgi:hypothetical protein
MNKGLGPELSNSKNNSMDKNNPPPISFNELVDTSSPLRRELKTIYDLLPATKCQRQGQCCALLPEMTFLEALQAMSAIESWPPADRTKIIRKMVRYFFCNAVEINSCPFLSGKDCLIYADRFFGCRAYGLWSRGYYQDLADQNRQGKLFLKQQWEKLGISLPGKVLSFQVPYCSRVEMDPPVKNTDEKLTADSDRIENLAKELNPWGREFRETYFSDLGFFLAGLQFGPQEAVRLKYFITRDLIQKGDRSRLNLVLGRVMDLF